MTSLRFHKNKMLAFLFGSIKLSYPKVNLAVSKFPKAHPFHALIPNATRTILEPGAFVVFVEQAQF